METVSFMFLYAVGVGAFARWWWQTPPTPIERLIASRDKLMRKYAQEEAIADERIAALKIEIRRLEKTVENLKEKTANSTSPPVPGLTWQFHSGETALIQFVGFINGTTKLGQHTQVHGIEYLLRGKKYSMLYDEFIKTGNIKK